MSFHRVAVSLAKQWKPEKRGQSGLNWVSPTIRSNPNADQEVLNLLGNGSFFPFPSSVKLCNQVAWWSHWITAGTPELGVMSSCRRRKAQRAEKALCLDAEPGSFSHNSKKKNAKCWEPPGWKKSRQGSAHPLILLVGTHTGATTLEKKYGVPQKARNRVAIWFSNPTAGHVSGEKGGSKDTCPSVFITALFTIAKP